MEHLAAARERRAGAQGAFSRGCAEVEASVPSPWPEPQRVRRPADFRLGVELGRGSYAVVLRATEALTGASVAVKRLSKAHVARYGKAHEVMREKEALLSLLPAAGAGPSPRPAPGAAEGGPRAAHRAGEGGPGAGEGGGGQAATAAATAAVRLYFTMQDSSHLYFVLQLCPRGDLQQQLWRYGAAPPRLCRFYARQLAAALLFLHARDIVHRDVKPDNVLLDARGRLRLADLAASRKLERHADGAPERKNSFVGTPEYVAPEVLEAQPLTPATDWWGFACVLLRMAAGKPPFAAETDYLLYERIMACDYWLPAGLEEALAALLRQLLLADPGARLDGQAVLQHRYLAPGGEGEDEAGAGVDAAVDGALLASPPEEPGPYVPALGDGGSSPSPARRHAAEDGPRPSAPVTQEWLPCPAAADDAFAAAWADGAPGEAGPEAWALPNVLAPSDVARLRERQQQARVPWLPLVQEGAAIVLALPAWRRHGLVAPEPVLLLLTTDSRLHVRARSDPLTRLKDLGTVRLTAACSADAWGSHALLVYTPRRVHYFALAGAAEDAAGGRAAEEDAAGGTAGDDAPWEDGGSAPAVRLAAAICVLAEKSPAQPALEDSLGGTAQDRAVAF